MQTVTAVGGGILIRLFGVSPARPLGGTTDGAAVTGTNLWAQTGNGTGAQSSSQDRGGSDEVVPPR